MKSWVLLVAAAMIASCTCRSQIPQQDETVSRTESRVEERQTETEQPPAPKSEQPAAGDETPALPEVVPAEEGGPGGEQPSSPEPGEPAEAGEPETAEGPVEAAVQAPGGAPPESAEKPPAEESFVVTEEVYNKTFDEVEEFVRTLNEIIRRRDYATWLTYLTEEYIRQKSDPEYLRQQSEMPLLKKNNIVLESLQDYFRYVVVPSRSQATIDDIEFIDEDHVKAISSIRGTRGILYLLERKDGGWKIGVWE